MSKIVAVRRPVAMLLSAITLVGAGMLSLAHATSADATITSPTGRYANGALLPTGRLVDPAGEVAPLGDFPVAITISPAGDIAVVSNAGQGEGSNPQQGNETLQVVDIASGAVVQTIADHEKGKDTFYNSGVAFSPDAKHVYVTGGGNDAVYEYAVAGGRLRLAATWITTRKHGLPLLPETSNIYGYSKGVAVAPTGKNIYVTNEQGGSVAALSTTTGTIAWETQLPGVAGIGPAPAGLALSPDGTVAYVTAQGQNVVFALDTSTGLIRGIVPAGDHPSAMAVTHDGSLGFVTSTNDDSISILDLASPVPTQVRQLSVHLFPGEANGSAPNAVAIDEQRKIVYVANAGDDAIAAFGYDTPAASWNPQTLHLIGFIPAAWYPTGVAVARDHSVLAVSAKGYGGVPVTNRAQYDGNDMVGLLNHVEQPSAGSLRAGWRKALHDLTFAMQADSLRPLHSPIPDAEHAGQSPIKHVVLIVRENRTFDQVFGDLPALGRPADADPQYLEFGRTNAQGQTVTPNAHDIAARFGTSDNFYSDGEASIQGHHWTTEGITTDYVEKSWMHYYSDRNHPYDTTLPVAYARCGSIFQQVALAGLTFRNFGELQGLTTTQAPAPAAPDASCPVQGGIADPLSLANHDSAGGNNLTLTSLKDTLHLDEIKKEYAPLVAADQVPAFTYVVMGNDHTGGAIVGKTTPQAQVATNDLAVGGLVDYLSHTPQWSSTAVFIMEDDSQDGLDHRDGHRNIFLLASPYAKQGFISHLHISQASVMHTIELILGLNPLSSYTQTAPVPYEMFTSNPNLTPYTAETPTYPIDAMNPSPIYGTAASVPIDVSAIDVAGPVLEAQIWEATRPGEPMPAMLLHELAARGGISSEGLAAWARGLPCACRLLLPGLKVALGEGNDGDG